MLLHWLEWNSQPLNPGWSNAVTKTSVTYSFLWLPPLRSDIFSHWSRVKGPWKLALSYTSATASWVCSFTPPRITQDMVFGRGREPWWKAMQFYFPTRDMMEQLRHSGYGRVEEDDRLWSIKACRPGTHLGQIWMPHSLSEQCAQETAKKSRWGHGVLPWRMRAGTGGRVPYRSSSWKTYNCIWAEPDWAKVLAMKLSRIVEQICAWGICAWGICTWGICALGLARTSECETMGDAFRWFPQAALWALPKIRTPWTWLADRPGLHGDVPVMRRCRDLVWQQTSVVSGPWITKALWLWLLIQGRRDGQYIYHEYLYNFIEDPYWKVCFAGRVTSLSPMNKHQWSWLHWSLPNDGNR